MPENSLSEIISRDESDLLSEWLRLEKQTSASRNLSEAQLTADARALLASIREATVNGAGTDIARPEWAQARSMLVELSKSRAAAGLNAKETASFVFSLKQALFARINKKFE